MKHKHYDILVQWLADQALELEYKPFGAWEGVNPLVANPISHPIPEWRIKPRMVKVGRREWPMPLEVAPAVGTAYWVAHPCSAVQSNCWEDHSKDHHRLSLGVIHLTKEAAQQHADALVCINRGDV